MDYLFKVYYKNREAYEAVYRQRLGFESTLKTKLNIKPYGVELSFPLYYVYDNRMPVYLDRIRKNDSLLRNLEEELPGIAKSAFLIDVLASELQSSNDLEGVESVKEEIVETAREILNRKEHRSMRWESVVASYLLLKEGQLKVPKEVQDIRKIYDKITKDEIERDCLPDGVWFRQKPVFIQRKGSVSGEIIHRGLDGEDRIQMHIQLLLAFLEEENFPLLLRVAVAHYYFGYIHPFYDGNGRVGRFISSLYLKTEYHYFTAMSLSRGCILKHREYYKAFDDTNSLLNRGEMNRFVDVFLEILIRGQEDIIEGLENKKRKLEIAHRRIEEDGRLTSELKKQLVYLLAQSYYFDNNSGIDRETLIETAQKYDYPVLRIKKELKEMQVEGLIQTIKKRPLIYCIHETYFE